MSERKHVNNESEEIDRRDFSDELLKGMELLNPDGFREVQYQKVKKDASKNRPK